MELQNYLSFLKEASFRELHTRALPDE